MRETVVPLHVDYVITKRFLIGIPIIALQTSYGLERRNRREVGLIAATAN